MGNWDKALLIYKKTLSIREAQFGTNHPLTAQTQHNMGRLYSQTGDTLRATKLHKQALKVFRAKLGAQHPSTLAAVRALSELGIEA